MGDIVNCIINDFSRKSQSGGMNISRDMNSFLFSKYLHDRVPCGNTILKADGWQQKHLSVWSEENCPDDDVSRSVSFRRKQGLMGNSAIVITHRPRWEPRAANHTLSQHHLQTECLSRRDILFSCLSHRSFAVSLFLTLYLFGTYLSFKCLLDISTLGAFCPWIFGLEKGWQARNK